MYKQVLAQFKHGTVEPRLCAMQVFHVKINVLCDDVGECMPSKCRWLAISKNKINLNFVVIQI